MKAMVVQLTGAVMQMVLFTGCFWNRSDAVVRERYDLPDRKDKIIYTVPVRLGVVKNCSGSGSNFTSRKEDNRIIQDERRNWLLPPEMMLEREFRTKFLVSGENEQLLSVDATICNFELTADGKCFDLTVLYQLRNRKKTVNVLSREHIMIGGKGVAVAVSDGLARSFDDVVKALPEFGVKLKKTGEIK